VTACTRCGAAVESDSATYCSQCRARVHDERRGDPIEVQGLERTPTVDQRHGTHEPACSEGLAVLVDGERTVVPVSDVHPGAWDYYALPEDVDRLDMDAVWSTGDELHAHTVIDGEDYEGKYVELARQHGNWVLDADVLGDDPAHHDWSPALDGFRVLWERDA